MRIPSNGGKFVLSWTWHPQPLPLAVPASTLHFAAMKGMNITILRPDGFELPEQVMNKASLIAASSGGSVTETNERSEAMEGAHVIYVNSWSSVDHCGNQTEEDKLKHDLRGWCVDESWLLSAR